MPSSSVRSVAGSLQLLLPMAMQPLSFLFDISGRGQMQFQRRRLQDRKHLLAHERVQPLAGEALARWLAVVDRTAFATVAETGAGVDILNQQAAAALTTGEQTA